MVLSKDNPWGLMGIFWHELAHIFGFLAGGDNNDKVLEPRVRACFPL